MRKGEVVPGYSLHGFSLDQPNNEETGDPGYTLHLATAGHHQPGSHPWLIKGVGAVAQSCVGAHPTVAP